MHTHTQREREREIHPFLHFSPFFHFCCHVITKTTIDTDQEAVTDQQREREREREKEREREREGKMVTTLSFEEPLETNHYINGSFVPSINGKTFEVINPATEERIATVQSADKDDVDVAVDAAVAAFKPDAPWRTMDATGRRDCMLRLADAIERNADYLATLESMNNGKPVHIAKAADLGLTVKCIRYYAGWADKLVGKTIPIDGNFFCYTTREPVGVVGQIIPWNFPVRFFRLRSTHAHTHTHTHTRMFGSG